MASNHLDPVAALLTSLMNVTLPADWSDADPDDRVRRAWRECRDPAQMAHLLKVARKTHLLVRPLEQMADDAVALTLAVTGIEDSSGEVSRVIEEALALDPEMDPDLTGNDTIDVAVAVALFFGSLRDATEAAADGDIQEVTAAMSALQFDADLAEEMASAVVARIREAIPEPPTVAELLESRRRDLRALGGRAGDTKLS